MKTDYNLNWDNARVIEITPDEVEVQLPDIYTKEGKEVMINCSAGIDIISCSPRLQIQLANAARGESQSRANVVRVTGAQGHYAVG